MHGLFKVNMQWNTKSLKYNYSLNFKSMSKSISPFLIILTMTHMMEFVSSAASVFITWDVICILVTSTFFSNLHIVREYICLYKPMRWQGSNVDGSWMFRHPRVLQCFFFSMFRHPRAPKMLVGIYKCK